MFWKLLARVLGMCILFALIYGLGWIHAKAGGLCN